MSFTLVRGGIGCSADDFPPPAQAQAPDDLFHFKPKSDNRGVYYAGRGAVQIGGYTVFVPAGPIAHVGQKAADRTGIVCVVVDLTSYPYAARTELYGSEAEVLADQSDSGLFVAPLYSISEGAMTVDFRPMPSLGAWEIPPEPEDEGGQ